MSQSKPRYWFKRRRFGFGWIPVTPEGWLTIAIYIAIVIGASKLLPLPRAEGDPESQAMAYTAVFMAATVLLLIISYAKGPKPRWRWGSKPGDNPDEDF